MLYCAATALNAMEDGNVGAAMLGTVVPAAFTVALLSTPRLRRQWDFRILVFALCVLLVRSILQIAVSCQVVRECEAEQRRLMLLHFGSPDFSQGDGERRQCDRVHCHLGKHVSVSSEQCSLKATSSPKPRSTLGFMAQFLSWICDCAILCRVLAFHPSTTTPQRKRFSIMAFPLAAHLPRVPLIVATVAYTTLEGYQSNRFKHIYTPLRVVEGGLQMVVNCYCSGCLLHKVSGFNSEEQTSAHADPLLFRHINTPKPTSPLKVPKQVALAYVFDT